MAKGKGEEGREEFKATMLEKSSANRTKKASTYSTFLA